MNQDEIIRMAKEASGGTTWWPLKSDILQRFAAMVAAKEREACAKVCDARYMGDNNREDMEAKRCAETIRARS